MSYQSVSFFIFKAVVSGVLIAVISSLAKTLPKMAALFTALPLMTILSLIWIYFETKDLILLQSYTKDVLIWLLPSLLFFIAALLFFQAKIHFLLNLGLSILIMFLGIFLIQKLGILD